MTFQQPPGQQPPNQYPPQQPYPPIQPKKSTPAWVWVVAVIGGLLVLGMIGSAIGGDKEDAAATTTVRAPATTITVPALAGVPTTTEAVVQDLTIPDVIGKNGQVAADELKRLGFTNVRHGSATPGVDIVLMLSNWTVTDVEPGVGTVLPSDSTVVLTLTKNNR